MNSRVRTRRVEQAPIEIQGKVFLHFDSRRCRETICSLSRSTFHRKRYDLSERNVITGPEIFQGRGRRRPLFKLIFDFARCPTFPSVPFLFARFFLRRPARARRQPSNGNNQPAKAIFLLFTRTISAEIATRELDVRRR